MMQPSQPHRHRPPPHLDPRSRRQLDGPPPVAPQHPVRGVRLHLHREHRIRRGHQRLGEQRMRTDRHHQQRLHLRPHHRPAGRERIRRRPGRRRTARSRRSRTRSQAARRSPARPRAASRRPPSARPPRSAPSRCARRRRCWCTTTSTVMRSSTSYALVTTRSTTLSRSSRSASARKPTRPRLTPSIGTPEARANSAPRSSVPSPPSTISSSHPSRHSGVASLTSSTLSGSGRWAAAASASSTRTPSPERSSPWTTSSALRMAAGRPVWASRKTVRVRFCVNAAPPPLHGRRRPGPVRAPRLAATESTRHSPRGRAAGWP